jgi:flagellar protein FlgJ
LTLSPTRRGDHRSLVLAFFGVLPFQYSLVATEHFDLFTVFIPVYVFLALPVASEPSTVSRASAGPRQAGFVSQHSQAAAAVSRETGIPASFMIGQAGHETGWGKSEIRHADGAPSFNLFGIKATGGWKGKVAEITTTEYINGEPRKVTAKFRAYDSYADSFRDYARLIGNSPRYDKVMDQLGSVQGFAAGLQQAGYATDPQYAAKLSRAINTTLSIQRAQS